MSEALSTREILERLRVNATENGADFQYVQALEDAIEYDDRHEPRRTLIDPVIVMVALREFMESVDYDLHKAIERPEDGGPDEYPEHTARFVETYERIARKAGL